MGGGGASSTAKGKGRVILHRDDELELRALVGIAWEHRGAADFREHVERIADWHDRRYIRAFERRVRSRAALMQLLRETDPALSRRVTRVTSPGRQERAA